MRPHDRRGRDLVQIAAAVVGSAAAAQVVGPPYSKEHDRVLDLVDDALRTSLGIHPESDDVTISYEQVHGAGYAVTAAVVSSAARTVEQQLNTYADHRPEGLHADPAGPAYVGANGRRLMLRETPEGLYLGGALIADAEQALRLTSAIERWATRRWVAEP